jgi:hypothetical protein
LCIARAFSASPELAELVAGAGKSSKLRAKIVAGREESKKRNRLKSKFLPVSKQARACAFKAKANLERRAALPAIYTS